MSENIPVFRPMAGNAPIVKCFNTVLVPAGQYSEELANKLNKEKAYRVKTYTETNPRFHNLVMVTLRDLWDNDPGDFKSERVFRTQIKLRIGWVEDDPIFDNDGNAQWVVRPLDLLRCKQEEKQEFYELLLPYVEERLGREYSGMAGADMEIALRDE